MMDKFLLRNGVGDHVQAGSQLVTLMRMESLSCIWVIETVAWVRVLSPIQQLILLQDGMTFP